jgi:hypothetical protein
LLVNAAEKLAAGKVRAVDKLVTGAVKLATIVSAAYILVNFGKLGSVTRLGGFDKALNRKFRLGIGFILLVVRINWESIWESLVACLTFGGHKRKTTTMDGTTAATEALTFTDTATHKNE